jgi:putative flippase GtrA
MDHVVEIRRFLRGCIVAAFIFAVYVTSGMWLRHGLGMDETAAALLGVLFTAPFSYFGHARFTFRVSLGERSYVSRFLLSLGVAFLTAWLVVHVGVEKFGLPFWIGLVLTTIIIPVVNYAVLRLYVFARGIDETH